MSGKMPIPSNTRNNKDLMVWATYLCGFYDGQWGHQEKVFAKAFELDHEKFSWMLEDFSAWPDKHTLAGAFQKAVREYRNFFLRGDSGGLTPAGNLKPTNFFALSKEGKDWCLAYEGALRNLYGDKGQVRTVSTSDTEKLKEIGEQVVVKSSFNEAKLKELTNSPIFRQWSNNPDQRLNKLVLASLFSCTTNSTNDEWQAGLEKVAAAVGDGRKDVNAFLEAVRDCLGISN